MCVIVAIIVKNKGVRLISNAFSLYINLKKMRYNGHRFYHQKLIHESEVYDGTEKYD
jgi:hypothetical protein